MSKMYLMCGLSGAGKTTFAKQFVRDNPDVDYFSIDDFYAAYALENNIVSPWEDPDASFKVWIRFFEAIHEAELANRNILIDTNAPTRTKRYQFIDWFPSFDEHNLIYIDADFETCRINNLSRKRVVPENVFKAMVEEFEHPCLDCDYERGIIEMDENRWDYVQAFYNINNKLTKLDVLW